MADADEDIHVRQDNQDVELDEETQDYRLLSSLSLNAGDNPSLPRRGEKDFEPNPTQHQRSVLDAAREAMHDALSYPRLHHPKNHVIGHYDPDSTTDSYVVVESARGPFYRSMGVADKQNRVWLLPEEALWLLERGSLDIRWPEERFGGEQIPMSLEAAYATLLGKAGLTLERYNVYAGLKRTGYTVKRSETWYDHQIPPKVHQALRTRREVSGPSLWGVFRQALASIFAPRGTGFPATGPLLAPGIYRNYGDIYRSLSLIKYHKPEDSFSETVVDPSPPFRITYNVWKPATPFKKSAPPEPDFRIAVLNARATSLPTLDQIGTLLDSLPEDPPVPDKKMEVKLRYGYRNVILAIVDTGVVSYVRFSDAAFGQEKLYLRKARKGAKGGHRKGQSRSGSK